MPWICQRCNEPHTDVFDACWKCAAISNTGDESENADITYKPFRPKFSTRTLLVFVTSLAVFLGACLTQPNAATAFLLAPSYAGICVLTAASIGYDREPTESGIWRGLAWGGVLCCLSVALPIIVISVDAWSG